MSITHFLSKLNKTHKILAVTLSFISIVGMYQIIRHPQDLRTLAAETITVTPSGEELPIGNIPGWQQIFSDDFLINVSSGSFPSAVSTQWDAYPDKWTDTSKRGTYYPSKVVSIHDGMMDMFVHTETVSGVKYHMVAAPRPKLSTNKSYGTLGGRYVVRFKADPIPGYKTAWLLWPDSNIWPRDGEIDFPEGDLTKTIGGYMHWQNATSGSQQNAYSTSATYTSWHTAVTEWLPGQNVKFYLDNVLIGNATVGSSVPNTSMHWVLQTETALSGPTPVDTDGGHVLIDWVAAYIPASTAPTMTPVPSATDIPLPTVTNTPIPTSTLIPTATYTPIPTVTNTPIPTMTPSPTMGPDIIRPNVSIKYPSNGSTVKRNTYINIQATATDNVGVTQVRFYVNGSLTCTDTIAPYTCNWLVPAKRNVQYTIQATSYDAANNSSSQSITITSR